MGGGILGRERADQQSLKIATASSVRNTPRQSTGLSFFFFCLFVYTVGGKKPAYLGELLV